MSKTLTVIRAFQRSTELQMQESLTLNSGHGWHTWDWERLRRSCLRETRRLLASEHDAEEVAQDALLRAWRGRGSQHDAGAEIGWVRSIARNEALRRLARQTLREDLYTEADAELLDGVPANQDVSLLAEIIDLRNAIAELAPRDALLLRLRYESDLTQGRLARVAGMPEGTVKIRLHRIRGRLRERLTGDND
jgi:RNA polymerase sigma-70 factor (ECF subfamily)